MSASSPHPFTFGIGPGGWPGPELTENPNALAEFARKAEGLGYENLHCGDHFDDRPGPLAATAVALLATTTVRVGALLLANDFRSPGTLFKELATLDVISDGRVDVGLGTGWYARDYAALDIDFDPPSERIARLAESIAAFKAVSSGEPYSHQGDHYSFDALTVLPRPRQRPHQRLITGGGGQKMLTLAGQVADVISINVKLGNVAFDPKNAGLSDGSHMATLNKIEWVKAAAGARFDEIILETYILDLYVGDDVDAAAERVATAKNISLDEIRTAPQALFGSVEEIIDILEERRATYGFSMIHVHAHQMDAFAPVVAELAGK